MRKKLVVSILSILFLTPNGFAKKKEERQWQTGKLLDTSQGSVYRGNVGLANGSATTIGNTTYGNANGSSTAVYRIYESYVIDAGDYVYECQERIRSRRSKLAPVTVNGPLQFALEKDHLYIKDEDGKEHDTKLLKKTLKLPSGS